MNHKAIYKLYPNAVTVDDTAGVFDAQGNKIEIDMNTVNSWVDSEAYKAARQYPSITDQLDMLWHAMNNNEIPKANTFYTAIQTVKNAHPKS
jgi:hypothetical protein